jgi:phosphoribosyl-ATP pyrophosphohydrolase
MGQVTMSRDTLQLLAQTIASRRHADAGSSYPRQLLDAGPLQCAKKLGEEAAETVIAAVAQDDEALKGEAADLLYHLLVVLEARNIPLNDVYKLLEARMGQSGLAEKAARSGSQDDE